MDITKSKTIKNLEEENCELRVKLDDTIRELIEVRTERDFHKQRSKEFQAALIRNAEELNALRSELYEAREQLREANQRYGY